MRAEGNTLAPLYVLRKDHKVVVPGNESIGPKTRPVCGAKDCHTRRLSHLLGRILQPIVQEGDSQCENTESLLAEFEKVNKTGNVSSKWIVGSLDVLYPSLNIKDCAKVVGEVLRDSAMKVENLQWKEVALYLKFNATEEEVKRYKVSTFLPKRRTRYGRPPTFTASGSDPDRKTRQKSWIFRRKKPYAAAVWKMFCLAIEILVRKTMEYHDFQFDNSIIRQKEGGSIGLSLTGDVASIFMNYWDKKLKVKLHTEKIEIIIYKRYVDDQHHC